MMGRTSGLACALVLASGAALAQGELTVSVWGGSYGETWKKHASEPFAAQTGVKVTVDLGPSAQRLSKLLATQGEGIDLFFITDHQMAVAKLRGLLQPVDARNVPNMANLHDIARDPLGDGTCPAITMLGVGLAYNKTMFPAPPASWKVLMRRDLPAKPALMDIGFSAAPAMLVHFAEMNGGGLGNVDPGFRMLAALKDHARFFKLFEVLDWINRGEASVAPMLNTFVKKDPNVPLAFAFPEDGVVGVVNLACIPKAAKNKAAAEKFLDFYLSEPVQASMAATFGETPVVKGVKVPDNIPYALIPIERFKDVKVYDPMAIGRQIAKWQERFQEEIVAR